MDVAEAYKLKFESFTGLVRQKNKRKKKQSKKKGAWAKKKEMSLGKEDEEDGGDSNYLVSTSVFSMSFFCVDNI